MSRLVISESAFRPEEELASFRGLNSKAGAIASFIGAVRDENGLSRLGLTHYAGATQAGILQMAEAAVQRFALQDYLIIHRIGELVPGEPIVCVACASAHRRQSLQAVDYLMDYLKSRAMFWKYEVRDGQKIWIQPRRADYQDAARWD